MERILVNTTRLGSNYQDGPSARFDIASVKKAIELAEKYRYQVGCSCQVRNNACCSQEEKIELTGMCDALFTLPHIPHPIRARLFQFVAITWNTMYNNFDKTKQIRVILP